MLRTLERLSCFSPDIVEKSLYIVRNYLQEMNVDEQTELISFVTKFKVLNSENYH